MGLLVRAGFDSGGWYQARASLLGSSFPPAAIPFLVRFPIAVQLLCLGAFALKVRIASNNRTFSRQARPDAFFPCLRSEPVVNALHRDAFRNRTDQRAKVAADALVLVHARNA